MKKYELIISDQAINDLDDIWLYIAADSPSAADAFLDSLF
jgi:plasmid stabilization system protein ParE